MTYQVRFSAAARKDLARLTAFIAERDIGAARRARAAINDALKLLEKFPFSCRTAGDDDPFLREMLVSFGHAGFAVLYKIGTGVVTVVAMRHQSEQDYY